MRRILVEAARRKQRRGHGGGALQRVELVGFPTATEPEEQLLAFDEALTRFAGEDPLAARVVELRYFTGASHEAAAAALGITVLPGPAEMDVRPPPGFATHSANDCGDVLQEWTTQCQLIRTASKPFFYSAVEADRCRDAR